jgi:hypothetical protein
MRRFRFLIFPAIMATILASSVLSADIDVPGIASVHSEKLKELFFATTPVPDHNIEPIEIHCVTTPGNHLFIGIVQEMMINASADDVSRIIDDYANYVNLFEDLEKVTVSGKPGNSFSVYTLQKPPVFFLSKVSFTVNYFFDNDSGTKKYLYKLKESKKIKTSDGVTKIIPVSADKCYFYEIDFIDIDWGGIGGIAPNTVWEKFVEGVIISDLSVKIKAENPGWSYKKIKDEAHRITKKINISKIVKEKVTAASVLR